MLKGPTPPDLGETLRHGGLFLPIPCTGRHDIDSANLRVICLLDPQPSFTTGVEIEKLMVTSNLRICTRSILA